MKRLLFVVLASCLHGQQSADIRAKAGNSEKTFTFELRDANTIESLSCDKKVLEPGMSATCKVTMTQIAAENINITVTAPAGFLAPATITMQAGTREITFRVIRVAALARAPIEVAPSMSFPHSKRYYVGIDVPCCARVGEPGILDFCGHPPAKVDFRPCEAA